MTFISYAQNFEDVMLWRALHDVEAGNYLDVGAQDPVVDSVSRAFYDAGWRGIHVEPTPSYVRALRENRPDELVVKAVVSPDPGLRTFYEIPGTGLSTGVAEIAEQHRAGGWEVVKRTVPSVPLASLLDQFEGKDIHWLKIDVEGMEVDVLRSWGDHAARPWVLVIESTYPNTQEPTHHTWIDEVTRRGYSEVYFDGLSRYFLAKTQMQRAGAFATPPNVFDQFHVERHHFASGLVRQGEEVTQRRMAATEQKAAEQEQRHQLELAQREEASGQRDALHQAQVEHLEHALRELEQAQDHFPALIGEKEGEIALLRQQLDHLRASHKEALAVSQTAMDRLGLELDRRGADLRSALERHGAQEIKLKATLSSREGELAAVRDALEQRQIELAEHAARLNGASSLLLDLQSGRLWRKTWFGRAAIDKIELATFSSRVSEFLARPAKENTALQHDTLDQGIKTITGSNMEMSTANAPRATTLDELLSHHDRAFVRCAYRTVLGREPDPTGESFYLAQLRSGLAKLHILRQMRRSYEGQSHDPEIAGLDRAIRGYWRRRMPIIGAIIRLFIGGEGDSIADRRHRILINEFAILHAELSHFAQNVRFFSSGDMSAGIPAQSQSEPVELNRLSQRGRQIYLRMAAGR